MALAMPARVVGSGLGINWFTTSPPGSERGDDLVEGRGMALAMPARVVGSGLEIIG